MGLRLKVCSECKERKRIGHTKSRCKSCRRANPYPQINWPLLPKLEFNKPPPHRDKVHTPSWTLYFDGACGPHNPGGVATYGWVLYSPHFDRPYAEHRGFVCEGEGATNNVAEFQALIEGLDYIYSYELTGPILCKGDSQLVIEIISGRWQAKKQHLKLLREIAWDLLEMHGQQWWMEWIPREYNTEADWHSQRAYKEHRWAQQNKRKGACLQTDGRVAR